MPESVSGKVQDDLIEQSVQLARVDAGLQRKIDARLDQLGADLKALTLDVDVAGTLRRDAQVRRMAKLDKGSRELIRVAYANINAMTKAVMADVAKVESMALVNSLEENIP